jgi:hypothetical protein
MFLLWYSLWYSLFLIGTYLTWGYLHEFAHLLVMKTYRKVTEWDIVPFPHMHEGRFYFARVHYRYESPILSDKEQARVAVAPRVVDLAAISTIVLLSNLNYFNIWVMTFLCGGIVDLITGSIGRNPQSDFNRYSKHMGPHPNIWRLAQWLAVVGPLLLA